MGQRDDRIDVYIAGSAEFARPILEHLRTLVHSVCPDVEETIKWSRPHFLYKGMLCQMSAFKEHCAFGFWKGRIILRRQGVEAEPGMGDFGKITCLSDLPPDEALTRFIHEAIKLNETGVASPAQSKPKKAPRELIVPDALTELLATNEKARLTFDKFTISQKREYVEWITEAKTEATRSKRLATTIEWLAEGKSRNWKYQNC